MNNDKQQIEIEFAFTKELFRDSYRNLFDAKVKPRNFIWVVLVLAVYFSYNIYYYGLHIDDLWFYLPLLGVPLGLLLARYYLPRRWSEKTYKRYQGKAFKWIISEQNIQVFSEGKKATLQWSNFEKATISKDIISLEDVNHKRTPIPISAFKPADLELFTTWLNEKVPG